MGMVLFMFLIDRLLHSYSLRHFQFMFLLGIRDIILCIGIRPDQFYIIIIGLIIITIIKVIAIAGLLTYDFLRIILIIYIEGLAHQL
jgi:hypothetical protein